MSSPVPVDPFYVCDFGADVVAEAQECSNAMGVDSVRVVGLAVAGFGGVGAGVGGAGAGLAGLAGQIAFAQFLRHRGIDAVDADKYDYD
jgi:hypothetical protein